MNNNYDSDWSLPLLNVIGAQKIMVYHEQYIHYQSRSRSENAAILSYIILYYLIMDMKRL